MTKPRDKRDLPPHPDDVWRPGERARVLRGLFNKITEHWTPEMREEERRLHAARQAARRRGEPG